MSNPKPTSALLQQLINAVLIVAVLALLGYASVQVKTELDWTANKRNTVTEASARLLASMTDPVTVYVFAPSGADSRRMVQEDLAKYQRIKKDINIEFVDPSLSPQKVRDFNINFIGEVVLEYQDRRENLSATTEQAITTALQRLSYAGEQFVVFIEGHGERSTTGSGPESYARLAQVLKDKGLRAQGINLLQTQAIPDNASAVVLASPQAKLFDGEIEILRKYVRQGGNLLWLADPDFPAGLDALAEDLGVEWQNGYAIFPEYQLLGTGHPGIFAAIAYPPHPVTQDLNMVTLFPFARSVADHGAEGWKMLPLLQTSTEAWLETGDIESGRVTHDEDDLAGPLNIGLTLTRMVPAPKKAPVATSDNTDDAAEAVASAATDKTAADIAPSKMQQQRVVLIGDADFLSDSYLGEAGNQQFGLNVIQWLSSRDDQINIDIKKVSDSSLYLPGWAMVLIAGLFVLVLPLLLIGAGVTRWALRRRR